MRSLLIATILSSVFISGCAALQSQPPTIIDNRYIDIQEPKLEIEFPYPIEYVSKKVYNRDIDRIVVHKVRSKSNDRLIVIHRANIRIGLGFYRRSESAYIKNKFHSEKFKNGSFVAGLTKSGSSNYLVAQIAKYTRVDEATTVKIYFDIGNISPGEIWKDTKKEQIRAFVSEAQTICDQIFKKRKA